MSVERIEGLINKMSAADDYDSVSWLLGNPVENISLSVVDDTIKNNADFQRKAGLDGSVTRYTEPTGNWPCKWCRDLAGTYPIDDYPKEMFMRHEKCRCIIEWDNKKTGTHDYLRGEGKGTFEVVDPATLNNRISFAGVDTQPQNIEKADIVLKAEKEKIQYRDVKALEAPLKEEEIITKIAGGDNTSGSCVSLAHAYVGNKKGLDVIDYRGGASRKFFSHNWHDISDIFKDGGAEFYRDYAKNGKPQQAVKDLMAKMKPDKEYMLTCGSHASIVKVDADGTYYYLELQSARGSGWCQFEENTLKWRFGLPKTSKYWWQTELVNVTDYTPDENYRELLGYLNTAADAQKKSIYGTIK